MGTQKARLRAPADFDLAIQQARMARGLSQTQLAAELDISQSAVSEIESGKSTIHLRRILELARLTGLSSLPPGSTNRRAAMRLAVELYGVVVGTLEGDSRTFDQIE